jgi:thiamine-monophosphate kinase
MLQNGEKALNKFTKSHLMPKAKMQFSKEISENITCDYAMMDTSDGLADALMQIAKASGVKIKVETSKIPHDDLVDMSDVLYGGEDYELVAAVPEKILDKISDYTVIGEILEGDCGVEFDGEFYSDVDDKIFNHFKEKNEN